MTDRNWIDTWSDEMEAFYAYMDDYGWAQHFHCGWEKGASWRRPQQVGDDGMCWKEWTERNGVVGLVARVHASTSPELDRQGQVRFVGLPQGAGS